MISNFKLTRYFSIASALAIITVTIFLALLLKQRAINDLILTSEHQNTALARSISNTIWPKYGSFVQSVNLLPANKIQDRIEIRQIHETLKSLTRDLPILKIKIYNVEGLTVYSSQSSQIGERKVNNFGLKIAIKDRIPASKMSFRDSFSAYSGELFGRHLVESYLPIVGKDGSVKAIFEIYADVTSLVNHINQNINFVLFLMVAVFLILFGVLFFIVRHGDRILKKQREKIAKIQTDIAHYDRLYILNQMATDIAHELNQPLAAIAAYIDGSLRRMRSEKLAPNSIIGALEKASAQAIRAGDVIRRLRNFLRREDRKSERVDVNESIDTTIQLMKSNLDLNQVTLSLDLEQRPTFFKGDSILFQQVILNLIRISVDAITATNSGSGELSIKSSIAEGSVLIGVQDSGSA